MGMVLSLSLVACGASTNNTNVSDSDIKELQERIEELEEENAELKATLGKIEETNTSEPETWADDYVIAFSDEDLFNRVKEITGKTSNITYGDVKNIKEFEGTWEYNGFTTLDSLKYFTSLEKLNVSTTVTNLDELQNLTNLTYLSIDCGDNLTDISALENLTNITKLYIYGGDSLSDISAIANLTNLTELLIHGGDNLIDIRAVANLTNLTELEIHGGDAIFDSDENARALDKLKKLEYIEINKESKDFTE